MTPTKPRITSLRGNVWRVEWTDRNGLERRAWCATWHIALVHALDCAAKTRSTR